MSANIQKRGLKYTVRYVFRGFQGRITLSSLKEARKIKAEIEAAHARGIDWRPGDRNTLRARLADIAGEYLDEGKVSRKPATVLGWRQSLSLFLRFLRTKKPRGKLTPDLMTRANLTQFFQWNCDVRGVKLETARSRTVHVLMFWQWACESEDHGESFPRFVRPPLPSKQDPQPTRAPSWAQCDAVISLASSKNTTGARYHTKIMTIARYTGLRARQIMGLKWDDVDMKEHSLKVRGELGKTRQERRGRIIPVTSHLIADLATWGRREGHLIDYPGRAKNEVREARGLPINLTIPSRGVAGHWEDTGLPPELYKQRPIHCFRKSFASELVMRGADRWAVELLCGRSTGMHDVYVDPSFLWGAMSQAVGLIVPIGEASWDGSDRFLGQHRDNTGPQSSKKQKP